MQLETELAYDQLKIEIEQLYTEVFKAVSDEPTIKDLLKGCKVFYSPLIYKPDVMFIGINPGPGEEDVFDCEYIDKGELEYLHYDYDLAKETKLVFEMSNKYDLLYNAFKTNFYYLATSKAEDIFKITNFLGRGNDTKLGERLLKSSWSWTKRLIEIIEPKLIICEGADSFRNVTDIFIGTVNMSENVESIFIEEMQLTIIGYKRRFSKIINKEILANKLKEL